MMLVLGSICTVIPVLHQMIEPRAGISTARARKNQPRLPFGLSQFAMLRVTIARMPGRRAILYWSPATSTAVPAQKIELKASEMVETREATWRRRNMVRRNGTRNQSWMAVADPDDSAANPAVVAASWNEANLIRTVLGVRTT